MGSVVALYFSLRPWNQDHLCALPPAVWAINQVTLDAMAGDVGRRADREAAGPPLASNELENFATDKDVLGQESELHAKLLSNALTPDNAQRYCFNKNGLVVSGLPPVEKSTPVKSAGCISF